MKVAFFYRRLNQGGIQRMLINCAEYFASSGHDVSIILIEKVGEYLDTIDPRIKIIPFENRQKANLFRSFKKILLKEEFDVLFTASPPLNIFAVLCKLFINTKTKIVISENNNTVSLFNNNKLTASKLTFFGIPLVYRFADCIVAVSKGLSDNLSSLALIPKHKIKTIYNPAFSNNLLMHMHDEISHPWLTDKQVPVLINVARLANAKNQKMLVHAVARVLKTRQVKLLIVGEGPLRDMLQEEIDKLNLREYIDLVGFQLNPVSWIAKSDLFVLSSDYEGFGMVVVEALATGVTVVTTKCDYGPSEIVNDGEYGYLASVGDEEDLANKILYALKNPLQKENQMQRAKDFHVDTVMEKYHELFTSLAVS
ncbi:glycosyltransferase [Pontibacter silvestris]|uniref:Glycosyltransferase n=1 Tax=Pontibacter silvestris TaxID=2305183 RepID=A0ABW4WXM1_9BACT|nr:glycosyltransferase [Pontibacter silvestris]MCC9138540.1 glycosyltransferase [Pontibacter silvestris]